MLRIDNGAVDVGKDIELVGNPQIVAVGGQSVRDDPLPHLLFAEWIDHALQGLLSNPAIALDCHDPPCRPLPRPFRSPPMRCFPSAEPLAAQEVPVALG